MRSIIATLALLACCAMTAIPAHAVQELIEFGFDQHFPPQTYMEGKQPSGFALDVLYAALTGSNYRISAAPGEWAQVQRNLAAGTIDVSAGMGKTVEREKLYIFPDYPYARFDVTVVVPEKSPIMARSDLKGITVATQKGSLSQNILERLGNISVLLYPSETDALRAMADGKADAFCGAKKTALYNIRKFKLHNLRLLDTPLYSDMLYFPVATQQPELAKAISEGMQRILKSNVYDMLYTRWFGNSDPDEYQVLLKVGRENASK
ncbi:MAG: transporter substrate-binding domain-containing protein [Desulfovibrio sp.]|uniref:transporter substrate-binding domain-containing protein n=1 Tax=Desulfovibrio sp. 7SRBS1 TaxID=3378064 RepID=UPI003B3C116F